MSLYNLLFGRNPQSALLLAVVGMRESDIERFRDVSCSADGSEIYVYTRTGGGNREAFPQEIMRHKDGWRHSVDDDYDSTYCTDTFAVPEQWREDVRNLGDIFSHGLRKEFAAHLSATLRREPTEGDLYRSAHDAEAEALKRTRHEKANGHTFVPFDDAAMRVALQWAEKNDGELRSAWGILPLRLVVEQDYERWPNAKPEHRDFCRADIRTEWIIDDDYWAHCQQKFSAEFPLSMQRIAESVEQYRARKSA